MQGHETETNLSPCQTSLWLFEQLGESVANLVPLGIHLEGPLDVVLIERALRDTVSTQAALRAVFILSDGMPMQQVLPDVPVTLEHSPFARQPGESVESALSRHDTWPEMLAPFDLASPPLFRARLYSSGMREHVLVLVFHHLIFDGWSCALLMDELAERYNALKAGRRCERPAATPYSDFVEWYATYLASPRASDSVAFWRERLAGTSPASFCDVRRDASRKQSEPALSELSIGAELSAAIRKLARELNATPFSAMCAALAIILQRHCGMTDLVIGTPFALRPAPQFDATLGCFVGALPIRLDLSSSSSSFSALVGQVRGVVRRSLAHAQTPFQNILDGAQQSHRGIAPPVFDVLLNVLNFPKPRTTFEGLTARRVNLYVPVSRFGFSLYVESFRPEIRLIAARRPSAVSSEYAENILSQLVELLRQAVARPETPVAEIVLAAALASGVPSDLRSEISAPTQVPIPAAFLEWAGRAPAAPAVVHGTKTWSYSELAGATAAVASRLQESGLRPGDTVAVAGQRSLGLIAAALGTLVAGGVLLLLDPVLPDLRLAQMLRLAHAKRLIKVGGFEIDADLSDQALETSEIASDMPGEGDVHASFSTSTRIGGDAAAYVFFTSGTTGLPKGVVGCHKGLSHFISWQRQSFSVGPGDRVALLSGLSFDVVLRDIFLPLASGATLVLPEDDAVGGMLEWLRRSKITVLHAVPTVARQWLSQGSAVPVGGALRLTFFAGEPLDDQLVRRWRGAISPSCGVVNLYGPTETTLAKCCYVVPDEPMAGVQPVGTPLPDTQVFVLRERKYPCAAGEIGEIVIRTPFRSKGYLPESWPSRDPFIVNDATGQASDLLYCTGDLGRQRADGLIELLGRNDDQLKINGARVELGEIAVLLRQHPRVADAAVRYFSGDGFTGLVGYVVAADGAWDERALMSFLRARLPAYMVPRVLISLPELPRTANGKTDTRCLLPPSTGDRRSAQTSEAPRSALEMRLAAVWRQVLGIDSLGIHDNFFDLGGTSLLLVALYAEVRKIVGAVVTIADLYRHPTIRDLSMLAEKERPTGLDLPSPARDLDRARAERQATQRRLLRQVRTQEMECSRER